MGRVPNQLDQPSPQFNRLRVSQPRADAADFGAEVGVAIQRAGMQAMDEGTRLQRLDNRLAEQRRALDDETFFQRVATELTFAAEEDFQSRAMKAPAGSPTFLRDFDENLTGTLLPETVKRVQAEGGYAGLSPEGQAKLDRWFEVLRREKGKQAIAFNNNAKVKYATDTYQGGLDTIYDYVQRTGDYESAKAHADELTNRYGNILPGLATPEKRAEIDRQIAARWVLSKSPTEQVDLLLGRVPPKPGEQPQATVPSPLASGAISPETATTIASAAAENGVDSDTLARIFMLESGGRTNPPDSSTGARGPFQFTAGTAKQYGLTDPSNFGESAKAAARLAKDNAAYLRRMLGREPEPADIYLAHQQGAAGAAALLLSPEMNAVEAMADLVGDEEVARRAITVNGGNANMTAGEFVDMWRQRFDRAGEKVPQLSAGPSGMPELSGERVIDFSVQTGTPVDRLDAETRSKLLEAAISDQNRERVASAQARKAVEDAMEAQRALQRVQGAINGYGTFDPKSKEDRDDVSIGYNAYSAQWPANMPPQERAARQVDFASRVGIVPAQMQAEIRGALRSGDGDRVASASETLSRLSDANPALLADFADEDIRTGMEVAALARAGMTPTEAAGRVLEAQRTAPKDVRDLRRAEYREQKYGDKNAAELADAFDEGPLSATPDVPAAARADYEALVRWNFETSATGDIEAARKAATAIMKRTWGVTRIDGAVRMMKYAPEAVYGVGRDDATWMREQLGAELQQVGAWARPVEDMLDDGSIRLVPNPRTTRADSSGRPMVGYYVSITNADGQEDLVKAPNGEPLLWRPDWSSSRQKQELDAEQAAEVERQRALRRVLIEKQNVNEMNRERTIRRQEDVERKRQEGGGMPTVQ